MRQLLQRLTAAHAALRKTGGYCLDAGLSIIEISGAEAASFLQARCSNDVLSLSHGQGQLTSFLDRQARILAIGTLHRLGDVFWLVVARSQSADVLRLLNDFKFRERAEFRLLDKFQLLGVYGAKSELVLVNCGPDRNQLLPSDNAIAELTVCKNTTTVIRTNCTGEPGLLFAVADDTLRKSLQEQAEAIGMVALSQECLSSACIENGYVLEEITGLMLAETGRENEAASYTKGCFPGQEVLARIKTYGAPKQGLMGLALGCCDAVPARNSIISANEKEIGKVIASCFSPAKAQAIAIVLLHREYRVPGRNIDVTIDGAPYTVTTVSLPFVCSTDRTNEARAIYSQALQVFANGSEKQAAEMLRDAIDLYPTFADAYESLGVILSRLEKLDEAISVMRQLAVLDPQSVMAHANLSVFYMQKGDKAAAEEEKAIAMTIRMNQMARAIADEQAEKQRQQADRVEAERRLQMFSEVLKIDPDDFLANAGVGSVYVDLGEYEKAVDPLKKALLMRPNHTVAYVHLGEAHEKLGKVQDAIECYRKGIAVASQRGDGEPLKKMQIALDMLTGKASLLK